MDCQRRPKVDPPAAQRGQFSAGVDTDGGQVGLGCAVVAAVLAILTFLPGAIPFSILVACGATCAPRRASRSSGLLDTEIEMATRSSRLIQEKARWLELALASLVISVALLAAGTLVR